MGDRILATRNFIVVGFVVFFSSLFSFFVFLCYGPMHDSLKSLLLANQLPSGGHNNKHKFNTKICLPVCAIFNIQIYTYVYIHIRKYILSNIYERKWRDHFRFYELQHLGYIFWSKIYENSRGKIFFYRHFLFFSFFFLCVMAAHPIIFITSKVYK